MGISAKREEKCKTSDILKSNYEDLEKGIRNRA